MKTREINGLKGEIFLFAEPQYGEVCDVCHYVPDGYFSKRNNEDCVYLGWVSPLTRDLSSLVCSGFEEGFHLYVGGIEKSKLHFFISADNSFAWEGDVDGPSCTVGIGVSTYDPQMSEREREYCFGLIQRHSLEREAA